MKPNPNPLDYPTEPSRLTYYSGTCHTPINTELWQRHMKTLRILADQAERLGLFEVAFELTLLIADHYSAQWREEYRRENNGMVEL